MTDLKKALRALALFLSAALWLSLMQVEPARAEEPVPSPPEGAAARPMPPSPYQAWDGAAGVPALIGDPRLRQIVVDNAELAQDVEVREAAEAALAAGDGQALVSFLTSGLPTAQRQATARKQQESHRDLAACQALLGTGGPLFEAEVRRVLAGSDSDRRGFLLFGQDVYRAIDEREALAGLARAEQLRARVETLAVSAGPAVQEAAWIALYAGDPAIAEFLATGYAVAAKRDADAREAALWEQAEREREAEALTDLARRSAHASQARANLVTAHGRGVGALERVANAMVSAANEARRAEQILAANPATADAFFSVKAEVARQVGMARASAHEAAVAAAQASVEASILVDNGLPYGAHWARMAEGMRSAADAAVKASETAQYAVDAAEASAGAQSAQQRAEAHERQAAQWRAHAEEHARAAASIAEAARVQAVAARDAADRTRQNRVDAEAARDQAWAAAARTRAARNDAVREQGKAKDARAVAERERANAAAGRQRADQQAASARSFHAEARRQGDIAASARAGAQEHDRVAAAAATKAGTEETNAAGARERAFAAEQAQQAAEARAQAIEALAAAARGTVAEGEARNAAALARTDANTASGAAGNARAAANGATGAAVAARQAATESTRAAARANAAAAQARAAAQAANAAANRAEAEAAATHAAAARADGAAAEATANEARASEAARNAADLASQAAQEAAMSLRAADRVRAESDAAANEATSAATQANLAVRASLAARASSAAIAEPANTAIVVAAPFLGSDLDADFTVLVAAQARTIGAEQANFARRAAEEAVAAAERASEAAVRAATHVKPAYEAASAAAASSAAAARSAADAQQAAAEAAADGAAAREAAADANRADTQARADAVAARNAANQANADAAIAGRSAAAADREAAAARNAAATAERYAEDARAIATRAETDAAAARSAADSAQAHADSASKAAANARQSAVEAQQAADRAEEAARKREEAERKATANDLQTGSGATPLSAEDEALLSELVGERALNEYRQSLIDTAKGIPDFLRENGAEIILEVLGVNDAIRCFGEGNIEACIWTLVNVASIAVAFLKLPKVAAAVAKVTSGIVKFLDSSRLGKKTLVLYEKSAQIFRTCSRLNSFSAHTPVLMADGARKPIAFIEVGEQVLANNPRFGETRAATVIDTQVMTHDGDLLDVMVDSGDGVGVIQATDNHPFWSETDRRWERAVELSVNDRLRQADGSIATVVALVERPGRQDMHDLTVQFDHSFYVDFGPGEVLVHNAGCVGDRWTSKGNLEKHFDDHAQEFGHETLAEYNYAAIDFMCSCNGPRPSVLRKQLDDTIYYFDTATNEYGMTGKAGIVNYYPADRAYFDRQPGFMLD